MFQGAQACTTPSWYPGKALHGKVVPTWNYVVAHVQGLHSDALRRSPAMAQLVQQALDDDAGSSPQTRTSSRPPRADLPRVRA